MSEIKTPHWYRPNAKKPKNTELSVLSITTSTLAILTMLAEFYFIDEGTDILSKNPYKGNSGVAINLGFLLLPAIAGLLLTLGGIMWIRRIKTEYRKIRRLDNKDEYLSAVPVALFIIDIILAAVSIIFINILVNSRSH